MEKISTSGNLLLSLCIPTYNRLPLLKEALSAIIDQIDDKISPSVEILISNNASTDGTELYVNEIIATYSHLQIKYFCNEENIGADGNIYCVTRKAEGEWIYMLSDDDVLLPGGLAKLLELIEKYPSFDAFCLNVYSFETDPLVQGKSAFDISEDTLIVNSDNSLLFLGTWITFISAMAFRRTVLEKHEHQDKIGTSLRHCYIYLDALAEGNGMFITQESFLGSRANNSGGFNFFEVFVVGFSNFLQYAKDIGYSNSTVQKFFIKHAFRFLVSFIVSFKTKSIKTTDFSINNYNAMLMVLQKYRGSISIRLTGFLLAFIIMMPSQLLSLTRTIKTKVRMIL
jgi:glycosyltransferase involved in cell wall biosynthesis